jgi:hypothetical protein
MFDFTPVLEHTVRLSDLTAEFTRDDLRRLTNEMIDTQLRLIAHADDADVTFTPSDPQANDRFALNPADINLPWTLGHVIAHITASSEESAFIAAELARGVEYHGRSRYEVPWQSVTTIQQLRDRLAESRRLRLASLELWPDQPQLDNTYTYPGDPLKTGPINAVTRFMLGLQHDNSHLAQIEDILRQSRAARN